MIVVACLIAIAIPAGVLYGIYRLNLYKTGEFKVVMFCSAAGIAAYIIAALINPLPRRLGWIDYNTMVRFLAPVVEETLKALILFYIVRRPKFTYFVDGAVYGFAVGIAFAVIENYEYIFGHPSAAMAVAVNRVVSTNLMHAAACATVGIVMGWARSQKTFPRIAFSLGGVLLAMALHMGFNNLVTRVNNGWLLVYAVLVGGGAAGLIALMIRRGFKDEQSWMQDTLGIDERVEAQEVAAVQNISKVDEVYKRVAVRFGPETAEKIKKLLIVQAHLGIQKKSAEKTPDEKLRAGIDVEIARLRREMEAARREIGSYAMAYLRYTHLEEMFSVYAALGLKLQELAAQPKNPGMNVYDRLGQRMVPLAENKTDKPAGKNS
ncbi:MAG TPA: PrsW family intramembrane metalloprotease [Anaerolineales bacterium]|nr:PrsW family intramembrane metalloprotease [Anaerolineales bacterium]